MARSWPGGSRIRALNYSLSYPFLKKEVLGKTNLGHPTYPRPKGTGDHSMSEKRGLIEVSYIKDLQGPRGMVKARLLELQFRSGQIFPRRYADPKRRHRVSSPCESRGISSLETTIPHDEILEDNSRRRNEWRT
jgi:hypothetical protein